MQSRIPPQAVFPSHHPDDPSVPRAEQVFGTRPVPISGVRPLVADPGQDSASGPVSMEIPKKRLRRAHTRFGIIIASLFGFYLVWTFVQAARDVEREQSVPAEASP